MTDDPRFEGIARLYGRAGLQRFAAARVMVIGLGGVGSWAAEALARSGIGGLVLADLDDICTTNINRQVHALSSTVGRLKVEVLAQRITEINPACKVVVRPCFITAANVASEVRDVDQVIDAIDSVRHKVALLAWCKRQKIPVVTAGGVGGLRDPLALQRRDLSQTWHDPLLAKTRKLLRQEHGFPANPKRRFGIEAIFSEEQAILPESLDLQCASSLEDTSDLPGRTTGQTGSRRLDCGGGYGSCTTVTAAAGLACAASVLRRLAALS